MRPVQRGSFSGAAKASEAHDPLSWATVEKIRACGRFRSITFY